VNAHTLSINLAPSLCSLLPCRLRYIYPNQPDEHFYCCSRSQSIGLPTREDGMEWKDGIEAVRLVSLSLSLSVFTVYGMSHVGSTIYPSPYLCHDLSLSVRLPYVLSFSASIFFLALLYSCRPNLALQIITPLPFTRCNCCRRLILHTMSNQIIPVCLYHVVHGAFCKFYIGFPRLHRDLN